MPVRLHENYEHEHYVDAEAKRQGKQKGKHCGCTLSACWIADCERTSNNDKDKDKDKQGY